MLQPGSGIVAMYWLHHNKAATLDSTTAWLVLGSVFTLVLEAILICGWPHIKQWWLRKRYPKTTALGLPKDLENKL
jgi:hypothetical protein